MGPVAKAPFLILLSLSALALIGAKLESVDTDVSAECAFKLAALDAPAPDVLFLGASRSGRAVDPRYMMDRIEAHSGQSVSIELLALTNTTSPFMPQLQLLLKRYLEQRGAPEHVVLELVYQFDPDKQRASDLPIITDRLFKFASFMELVEIRSGVILNAHQTVLPRTFEAEYRSLPSLALQKIETSIFAALRWPARQFLNEDRCEGEEMYRHGNQEFLYNTVHDDLTFEDSPALQRLRANWSKEASGFLPLAPSRPFRHFETDRIEKIISMLEDAGSSVTLMIMPSLGDTELTQVEVDEIATVFPGYPLIHPYNLFESEVGAEFANSFSDTHHMTPYAGLIYSRYLIDELLGFDF